MTHLSDTDQAPYSSPAPQTATVSDEAVQVSLNTWYGNSDYLDFTNMRNALTAALPHLALTAAPCSVEVKKLRWVQQDGKLAWDSSEYRIYVLLGSKPAVYRLLKASFGTQYAGDFVGVNALEAAKAAAQADFDRRILSQIVTKPVDVAAVREQCASIADEFARSRPLITKRPSSLIVGRWEGEQAAACAIATAIRALSPAEPVDQWQDISTAPKNGGFLAANSKEVWAAWHYDSANWHAKYGSRGATHWMPLPSAPTSKGGE